MIRDIYGWEPSISLQVGLEQTYRWIYDELVRDRPPAVLSARVGAAPA